MAVVNEKKKVQQVQQVQQPQAQQYTQMMQNGMANSAGKIVDNKQQGYKKVNPYAGLTGISANTAQQIATAQQGYQSPYATMLNGILEQITHPQEFNYEFNKDNLFQAYSDLYTQQGRQASLDAQGQAAGLTGGYGNSYGAAVGNQAYQQWLTKLYDKGLEFYDRARQRYNDDWNMLLNQYDVVNGQDQQGYQQWLNNLNYWTGLGQSENQDYYNGQNLQMQQQEYALGICQAILANGQMPSAELLAQAGLSAADAQAMMAQMIEAGGGHGGGHGNGQNGVVYQLNGGFFVNNNGVLEEIPQDQALSGNYLISDDVQNYINHFDGLFGIHGNQGGNSQTTGKPPKINQSGFMGLFKKKK